MSARLDVLVVEDNPADAEFVLESLRASRDGIHTFHSHDGADALDFLFARGAHADRSDEPLPRLVLLDIKLPKIDGFDVLREMKRNAPTRLVPVVILTSSNVERDVALGYQLGVNSYVQKPLDFGEFRQAVQLIGRYWLGANLVAPLSANGGGSAG